MHAPPYPIEQSPKTPPMNTSPTNSPAGSSKIAKKPMGKELSRNEGIISQRSHAGSPVGSASSSQSGEISQELPQIRNIINMQPYLIGRNFEAFSGVMYNPHPEEEKEDVFMSP